MRVLIQRVLKASVQIDHQVVGSIEKGYVLFVGIHQSDTHRTVQGMAKKVAQCRIFGDELGKLNLDIRQVNGQILSVSQFTLYGDLTEGNRPSFTKSSKGEHAKEMWDAFNEQLQNVYQIPVQTGIFGADMAVELINDGPVTIWLDRE